VKKKLLAITLACLFIPSSLFAEAKEYKTGSMIFSFKGGTTLPTFIYFPTNPPMNSNGIMVWEAVIKRPNCLPVVILG
jgi:hypothetical protein